MILILEVITFNELYKTFYFFIRSPAEINYCTDNQIIKLKISYFLFEKMNAKGQKIKNYTIGLENYFEIKSNLILI